MSMRFRYPTDPLFDTSGNLLSGGKLYFYASDPVTGIDISTPKDTYSDKDLTTPNTNPVVLDSSGRQGDIWLAPGSYGVILKTSSGSVLKTVDPVITIAVPSGDYADTWASARAIDFSGTPDGQIITVSGHWAKLDGNGGRAEWDSSCTDDENGGTRFRPDNIIAANPGRLKRIVESPKLYSTWFGAVENCTTLPTLNTPVNPVGGYFGNDLSAAQAVYPHADSVDCEVDWCAAIAASNWAYVRDLTAQPYNWSCLDLEHNGPGGIAINRPLELNHVCLDWHGSNPTALALGGNKWLAWSGAAGSAGAPNYLGYVTGIYDDNSAPSGKYPTFGAMRPRIWNLTFRGMGASIRSGAAPSVTNYISGLRIGRAIDSEIDARFDASLYDGVVYSGIQLFPKVKRSCSFAGIHRRAIDMRRCKLDFSTTLDIDGPDFSLVGQYCVLADFSGSVEANPIIRLASPEGNFTDSYWADPANQADWTSGVPAPICVIAAGNLIVDAVRNEGNTDTVTELWADLHLVDCTGPRIKASTVRNVIFTSRSIALPITTAGQTDLDTNYSLNINAANNYPIGISTDHADGNVDISMEDMFILNKIITVDNTGIGSSHHSLRNLQAALISAPYHTPGGGWRMIQPRSTAIVSLMSRASADNLYLTEVSLLDVTGYRQFGFFDNAAGCGNYKLFTHGFVSTWAPSTAYVANCVGINLTNFVSPTTGNEMGSIFKCIVAGTSDATTEPNWASAPNIGNTVAEASGTGVWENCGTSALTSVVGAGRFEIMEFGNRRWLVSSIPTESANAGDYALLQSPAEAGSSMSKYVNRGWICVGGTTWLPDRRLTGN